MRPTFVIRIPLPRTDGDLLSNLVGLLGLVAVVVGVGGITGNWWTSLILAGAACVFLSWVAAANREAAEQTLVPVPGGGRAKAASARPA